MEVVSYSMSAAEHEEAKEAIPKDEKQEAEADWHNSDSSPSQHDEHHPKDQSAQHRHRQKKLSKGTTQQDMKMMMMAT